MIRACITMGGWRILITRSIVAEAVNQLLEHAQAQATCCQKHVLYGKKLETCVGRLSVYQ